MAATTKQIAMAAAALIAVLSAPAFAADAGAYVFGSAGLTNYGSFDPDITGADSKKTGSYGVKGGGGYLFNLGNFKLGGEGGYVDLGKAKFTFAGQEVSVKAIAGYIAAIGVLPFNDQFSMHLKLGLASGSSKVSTPVGSSSGTSITPMYGIGGQFEINRNFGIRAEFEAYEAGKKGNANDPNDFNTLAKINMLSAGMVYKFGN